MRVSEREKTIVNYSQSEVRTKNHLVLGPLDCQLGRSILSVSLMLILISFLTLMALLINEEADVRNQRRARLDFGTKLGMNSPF